MAQRRWPAAGEIVVHLEATEGGVHCTIEHWGEALGGFGGTAGLMPVELAEIDVIASGLRLGDLGSEGKRLSATVRLAGVVPGPSR